MQVPFEAVFLGRTYTVEAVTDTSTTRYYWVRSKHGVLVKISSAFFD